MDRTGNTITVNTIGEAERAAVAAATVCTLEQLWRKPEIGDLWDISQTGDVEGLPVDLTAGASRLVVRGLRNQINNSSSALARLAAHIDLRQLNLPIEPGARL